ncbi:MAG TPA: MOSC domain-containing protein [Egibacteraceae bacterium]|nr:MOSC domain-containing protein [Egibacteraceae bacterium]
MYAVSCLSLTPVKGMRLHHPDEIVLGPSGVADDRRLYVIDERGRLCGGARLGRLVQVRPSYDDEAGWLALDLPDGRQVEGTVALGEAVTTRFYLGRRVTGRLVEGPWNAALSDFAGKPVRLVRTGQPGQGTDVHPVTLLGQASVAELARHAGCDEPLDARRFRMLVTFAGGSAYDEEAWDGQRVRLGDAVVRVRGPVPRCAVTTRSPDTGRKDFDALQAIAAARGLGPDGGVDFGVYAEVVEPGRVRVGDPLELLGP